MVRSCLTAVAVLALCIGAGSAQDKGDTDKQQQPLQRLRREVYNLQLSRAALLAETDTDSAFALLHDTERCPAELRDFTWHLLRGTCRDVRARLPYSQANVYRRQKQTMQAWTFSADSKTLIAAYAGRYGESPLVRFAPLDTASGRQGFLRESAKKEERYTIRTAPIGDCVLSPDGKVLLTTRGQGDYEATLELWDAATGHRRGSLIGRNHHLAFRDDTVLPDVDGRMGVFTPDGKVIVTASKENADLYLSDAATGKELRTLKGAGVPLTFTPDGKSLLSLRPPGKVARFTEGWYGTKKVCRIDLATGELHDLFDVKVQGPPSISADAGTLLTWTRTQGYKIALEVWDVNQGKQRCSFILNNGATFQLCPDGKTLAVRPQQLSDHVRLWDLTTGKERVVLPGYRANSVKAFAFSYDGKTLATGHFNAVIRFWDVATGKLQSTVDAQSDMGGLFFSPDGRMLLSVSRGEIRLLNTPRASEPLSLRYDATTAPKKETGVDPYNAFVAYSPDGGTLLSGNGGPWLHLWDAASGKHRATLQGHTSQVTAWSFSPDGKLLASGSTGIRLWDTATGKERAALTEQKAPVSALAFTPDGRWLAAGFGDGTLRLWDVASGKPAPEEQDRRLAPVRAAHKGAVRTLAFVGGDTLLLHSADGLVAWWDLARGRQRFTVKRDPGQDHWPRERIVRVVALAPDGKTFALVGSSNRIDSAAALTSGQLNLFDMATGRPRGATPFPIGGTLVPFAYSPDGTSLAAGSSTGTVRILDVKTGRPRNPIKASGTVIFRKTGTLRATDPLHLTARDGSRKKEYRVNLQFGKTYAIEVKAAPGSKGKPAPGLEDPFQSDNTLYVSGAAAGERLTFTPSASGPHSVFATARPGQFGAFELTVTEMQAGQGELGARVTSLAFSPDGKTVATGGPNEVRFWDPLTGQERGILRRLPGLVNSVAFAPDGRTLALVCQGGAVQLVRADIIDKPTPEEEATETLAGIGVHFKGAPRKQGTAVIDVDCYKAAVTDADLALLKEFKRLRTLSLRGTPVTDAGLAHLEGLDLQTLSLSETKVTEAGLAHLKDLKNLEELDLHQTNTTDAGLARLKDLERLKRLLLDGTPVTDAGLVHLGHLKNLEELGLRFNSKVTDEGLAHLKALKNLSKLDLGYTKVTGAGLKELAGLKKLATLWLEGAPLTEAGLKEMAALKGLATLSLEITDARLQTLRAVDLLRVLRQASGKDGTRAKSAAEVVALDLRYTPVTGAGLKELTGLKNLSSLNLSDTKLTGEGLKELAGLKNLTTLILKREQVTDATLRILREIGLLHALSQASGKGESRPTSAADVVALDLSSTPVTEAGLKELASLNHLATLDLTGTKGTDAGLAELAGMKSLTTLSLELTDARLRVLREAGLLHVLRQASSKDNARPRSAEEVVSLTLGRTPVTVAGLKELAGLKNLAALDLGRTKVTGADLKELAGLKKLTALRLDRTQVTDAALAALREIGLLHALHLATGKDQFGTRPRSAEEVIALDLHSTPVTGAALKELTGLKNLSSLDLGSTPMTDAGLKHLAGLNKLTSLSLSQTGVTHAGVKHLAGLKDLSTLALEGGQVTDELLRTLREIGLLHAWSGAKGKDTARPKAAEDVVVLDLGRTRVTEAGLKELAGLKKLITIHLPNTPTDATLRTLRELGLLHAFTGASGKGGTRPGSEDEVVALNLSSTNVGNEGLKEIAGLKNLATLNLNSRQVMDAGLIHLKTLTNLRQLDLPWTKVSNAGLIHLKALTNLRQLDLRYTQVTDVGVRELQAALPLCKITH